MTTGGAETLAGTLRFRDYGSYVEDLKRGSVMGLKLAAMIRERWPPIELILTSSASLALRANTIPARGVFLGKPFDSAAIISTIRNFVGPRASRLMGAQF